MDSRPPSPGELMRRAELAMGAASSHVRELGRLAQARGHGAWLVGGGVRDVLLGTPVHDVDLCFEGDVLAWAPELVEQLGGTLLQHPAFHTATWTVDGLSIDLISTRSERYLHPGSLPVVELADLRADLARRDFSVNAMAMAVHPAAAGELVDPEQGHQDLVRGVLRVLHPYSFVDDPTRALRGARYAARLDLELQPSTALLLKLALPECARLGPERLGKELGRVFSERRVQQALELLESWGVLQAFDPALAGLARRVQEVLARGRQLKLSTPRATLGWVALAQHLGPHRERLEALVRSDAALLALWQSPAVDGIAVGAEPGVWGETLSRLPEALLPLAPKEAVDWWVHTGRDLPGAAVRAKELMAAGVPKGPALGEALRRVARSAWRGQSPAAQLQAGLTVLR